jgi:NifB/MoaA-like Fe-S oxidoreductase
MDMNRPRLEDNIKTDLKLYDVDWIRLSKVMGKSWAVVQRVKYLARQQNVGVGGRKILKLF